MTKAEIMKLAVFPQLTAERRAKQHAESWADYDCIDEEQQDEVIDQYVESGRIENQRLRPLIEALAESNEKLADACRLVIKLWDADAPDDMIDESDVRACREALADYSLKSNKGE